MTSFGPLFLPIHDPRSSEGRSAPRGVAKSPASRHFPAAMTDTAASVRQTAHNTTFVVLFAIAFSHLLNDMMQSLIPAIYPNLKADFHLSFAQIGVITLINQITASLLQPA